MPEEQLNLGVDASKADEQIASLSKIVDYRIREYPIEVLVNKFLEGEDEGINDIYVPDYQRNFIWPDDYQSRFIESVLIGLPIPYLFVGDVSSEDEERSGRVEIIDGTQRIRTLAAFLHNELKLTKLIKLTLLNGFRFSDLLPSRQRRFRRFTIRMIELTEHADEETRRDMFDRINSGTMKLNPMETRRGVRAGPFLNLIIELSKDAVMHELAPLSRASIKRRDYEELVVRFFAYADRYQDFERSVIGFIDEYIDEKQAAFGPADAETMKGEWQRVMSFVQRNFIHGFKKDAKNTRTPRVRFEAIAVGVALALRAKPKLKGDPKVIQEWAHGAEFKKLVTSDGANSRPKVKARIEYVRDQLLRGK